MSILIEKHSFIRKDTYGCPFCWDVTGKTRNMIKLHMDMFHRKKLDEWIEI